MDKFKGQYRIPSARANWWNYSNMALYFVTICTNNRQFYFGHISDKKMQLSLIGALSEKYWYEIPDHFPFVKLHAFVVMPDHVHGIIEIANSPNPEEPLHADIGEPLHADIGEPLHADIGEPLHARAVRDENMAAISPKRGSLASIIRSYKSAVSRDARKENSNFAWQSRFYDHIIRDDGEYDRISKYIIDNPKNWNKK
jgi:putative transposase